ncbi:MAG: hypothetical protein ACE1Z4_06795, partial [Gammaproteobacteria bacterium]
SVGGDQGTGNAEIFLLSKQPVGIKDSKCQSQDSGYGRERNVAFVPGNPQAKYFLVPPRALADDPLIGDRTGIGSR